MQVLRRIRRAIRKVVFGDTLLPHGVTLGFVEPQREIAVWLHGLDTPLDVTHRHSMACAAPFTICLAFDEKQRPNEQEIRRLSLRFCEGTGQKRLLGELKLKASGSIPTIGPGIFLFEVRKTKNNCLPLARLWAHDLLRARRNWRRTDASALKMTLQGMRAMTVMFIRPHPVSLVSHCDAGGNIFPMNLMGELGGGYFAFALVDSREAAIGVERARRIAVSSVPFPRASLVFQLAPNHFRESVDWSKLPFGTKSSANFSIPVPDFTSRVRELEIVHARKLGSHTFFVARIVHEDIGAQCESLHVVDGIYHAWRVKGRGAELEATLTADSLNKHGAYTA